LGGEVTKRLRKRGRVPPGERLHWGQMGVFRNAACLNALIHKCDDVFF